MQKSLCRSPIIGVLVVALWLVSGCSTLRFGYNTGPELLYWWIDGYIDMSDAQMPHVRGAIADWFKWHRSSQLTDYAALLARAQAEVLEPVTPAQVCHWSDELVQRADTAFDRALPAAADAARTLAPAQLAHLQRKYDKNNAEFGDDFLQASTEERMKASLERVVDRAEMLYGRLSDAQRERIARLLADSPFDAEKWFAERKRRQQDTLALLRRLSGDGASAEDAQAALKRIYEQMWRSPREAYRAYQQRLADYNCGIAAQIHNAATPEQRRHAARRMKGWEDDLRALAAG